MPIFSDIRGVGVYGGTYYEAGGNIYQTTFVENYDSILREERRGRKRRRSSSSESRDASPRRKHHREHEPSSHWQIKPNERIRLQKEICVGPGYRVHLARHRGRAVTVKVFEGPDARQQLISFFNFNRSLMHPNLLQLRGVSSPSSDVPFIIFEGAYRRSAECLIASALGTDLQRCVTLGLRTIADFAVRYLFRLYLV